MNPIPVNLYEINSCHILTDGQTSHSDRASFWWKGKPKNRILEVINMATLLTIDVIRGLIVYVGVGGCVVHWAQLYMKINEKCMSFVLIDKQNIDCFRLNLKCSIIGKSCKKTITWNNHQHSLIYPGAY